ncbi:pyrolysin [Ceratobasidium sp. AG-Ba]|nr:pyrolysin [Ceratobasidium sp. AG-Ba]QRW03291.1 pyrolysin [Ceratobasidium sp. AG-Ba]
MNLGDNLTAFQRWSSAYDRFKNASNALFDASTALCQSIDSSRVNLTISDVVEQTLLQIYNKLDSIDTIGAQIARSRAMLYRTVNMSATLVPVNTLPSEVLAQVFMHSMPELEDSLGEIQITHQASVIASVCSRWRKLSIATPSLWSCINVVRRDSLDHQRYFFKLVGIWLERASGAPLHLYIRDAQRPDHAERELDLVSLLKPWLPRIATLHLYESSLSLCESIIVAFFDHDGDVALNKLDVTCPGRGEIVPLRERISPFSLTQPTSVLQGLNHLELGEMNLDDLLDFREFVVILSNMRALRTLVLQALMFFDEATGEYPEVTLPDFQKLVVRSYSSEEVLWNLVALLRPGPNKLVVRLSSIYSNPIGTAAFFQHANVTVLSIDNLVAGGISGLTQSLDNCPHLQSLQLTMDSDIRGTLEVLTKEVQGGTVARCPGLRRLQLVTAHEMDSLAIEQLKKVAGTYSLTELDFNMHGSGRGPDDDPDTAALVKWLCQRVQKVWVNECLMDPNRY